MHATRAAVEEGIVPGGGVALLNASVALDGISLEGDAAIGVNIVRRAIEEPCRQIAANAGQEGSVVVNQVRTMAKGSGYNAATNTYEDLIAAGVVDPAKVVRTALQNAASIAGLILTTECLISEKPQPPAPAGGGGHDHGGGGMGGMY
jgi:chaperonin GroEL